MKEERNISKEIWLYENGRFMSVTIFLQMELDRTICRSPLTLSLRSTIDLPFFTVTSQSCILSFVLARIRARIGGLTENVKHSPP